MQSSEGMRVLVLALGLAVVGGAAIVACGGDVQPNYGPADGLVGRQPPPAGTAPSSSGSSSGGATSSSGSGSGSGSGSSSGGTASGSSSGATGDGGTTGGGDGGQTTMGCQISWSNTVYPMLNSTGPGHCSSGNCHATGVSQGGITLDDGATKLYGQLVQSVVGANPLVKPNDTNANDSSIVCVLQGTCGPQMPVGFPALTGQQIEQVQTWVQCGSPQN